MCTSIIHISQYFTGSTLLFSPGLQIGKSTNIMTYKFGLVGRGLVLVKCMIKMELKVLGLKRVWGYWAI